MAVPDLDRGPRRNRREQVDAWNACQHVERARRGLANAKQQARAHVVVEQHVVARHRDLGLPEVSQHPIRQARGDEHQGHLAHAEQLGVA